MQQLTSNESLKILEQISTYLKNSEIIYQQYLESGKIFRYAKDLYQCNYQIRFLLLDKGSLLPKLLQQEIALLVDHYNVWINHWNKLHKEISPSLNDVFVFYSESRFPKNAAIKIEQEFLTNRQ